MVEARSLVRNAVTGYFESHGGTLAAAVAYRALFTAAPLGVLTLVALGALVGQEAAAQQAAVALERLVGPQLSSEFGSMVMSATRPQGRALAGVLAGLFLIYAAASLLGAFQESFDVMLGMRVQPGLSVAKRALVLLVPFLVVLLPAAALLAMAAVRALIEAAVPTEAAASAGASIALGAADLAIGWAVAAAMLWVLPGARLPARSIALGSAVTAFAWVLVTWGFGVYLSYAAFSSVYGAAGSLVAVLVWFDLMAQVSLFGAKLGAEHARLAGLALVPKRWAEAYRRVAVAPGGASPE